MNNSSQKKLRLSKSLFFIVILLSIASPAKAEWGIFDWIASLFYTPVKAATGVDCPQDWNGPRIISIDSYGGRVCHVPDRDDPQFQPIYEAMRDNGKELAKSDTSCQGGHIYRSGCQDCPGPEHPMTVTSNKGYRIRFLKPGQNHVQPSTLRVLGAIAERKGKNLIINSGYRSCEYQHRTRQGVQRSQHLLGKAADFTFERDSESSSQLASFARSTLDQMGIQGGGVGTYSSGFAHVDTRSRRSFWDWR